MQKKYKVIADCKDMYEEDIINTILENRGIKDIDVFLNPREEDLLPLESLKNIDRACDIINDSIYNRISVMFDVDTDGVCAGTIMTRYLKHFADNINTYINNGKTHGLSGQCLDEIAENTDLLIIVDSLDSDTVNYKYLYDKGVEIVVLDHHMIDKKMNYSDYITLVSSQDDYDNKELSGAGVVWKVCKYLDAINGYDYADDLVDLAACGILADVCDVSENNKENRYIVYSGLNNMKNPAIKKIVGGFEFNSKAVLFSIAPLINACCRIGDNEAAMNLFLEDNNKNVLALKKRLEKCREIQREEIDNLLPSVEKDLDNQSNMNVLYSVIDTPYGVAGVLGNKCLEVYNKPLFILKEHKDEYSGSMRSEGYGDFLALCQSTGLAELHGHEQASGVIIKKENFKKFIDKVNNILSTMKQTSESEIDVDCEIRLTDITRTLIDKVKRINYVSGSGFKPLLFKVVDIDDYTISSFKDGKHLVINPNDYTQIIEWNTKADFDYMEECAMFNEPIEAIGELDSGWMGRSFKLKLIVDDLKVGE